MNFKTKLLTLAFLLSNTCLLIAQSPIDYVPEDATFVFSMNPQNLRQKVDLDQLMQLSFFQDMYAQLETAGNQDASASLENVAKSPGDYGFDFTKDSYATITMNDEGSFFSYIFTITDVAKASTFLKGQAFTETDLMGNLIEHKLKQGEGFEYLDLASGMQIAWTDKIGMLVMANVEEKEEDYSDFDWEDDYSDEDYIDVEIEEDIDEDASEENFTLPEEEIDTTDSLEKVIISEYLNKMMQATSSINKNPRFMADARSGDMHFWMDYAYIQSLNKESLPEELAEYGLDMLYEQLLGMYADSYISMNMNFDKGAMNIDSKTYMSYGLGKIWSASTNTKFNKKIGKYIKGDELLGYMAFNYDMGQSIEATKLVFADMMNEMPMVGGMANSMMEIVGIAIDEEALYNLWKGDMVFALTGLQEFEKEMVSYEYDEDFNRNEVKTMSKETLPTFTMAMSYGNKKDLMKFIRLGEQLGGLQAKGKYFEIDVPDIPMNMYMALQDGVMLFTNDKALVTQKLSKGYPKKQRMSKEHCQLLKEKASTFYWDFPRTFDMAERLGLPIDMAGDRIVNMTKETFESMLFTADKVATGGVSKGRMSFNFSNKEQNSLEQFFYYINDMYISAMGGSSL